MARLGGSAEDSAEDNESEASGKNKDVNTWM